MNRQMVQGVLSKAGWYFVGNGSSRLLTLGVLILAGRALGPEEFGLLAALLGLSLFLTSLAELGLTTWATRRIAANRNSEHETLDAVLSLSAVTSLATLVVTGIIAAAAAPGLVFPMLLILWYGCCTLVGNSLTSSLIARERPRTVAGLSLAEKSMLLTIVVAFAMASPLTLWAIGIAYAAAGTLRVTTTMYVVHKVASWSPRPTSWSTARASVSESWPFGLTQAIHSTGGRLDVLFVALFSSTTAGLFSAAFRLIEAAFLLTHSLTLAFLPIAVRARQDGEREFRRVAYLTLLIAATISVPITGTFMLGSEFFIQAVYGSEFSAAASVLAISSLFLPFSFVSTTAIALLNAAGLEKRVYPLALGSQIVRLVGVVALALLIGPNGPAIGVVLSAALAFGGYALVLQSALKPDHEPTPIEQRLELSEASN